MLWDRTWYSIQNSSGAYLVQKDNDGNPLSFSHDLLDKHFQGEVTYAIHSTHPVTRKCKFGGIDFDFGGEPNREHLQIGLTRCMKVYFEAQKAGLSPYIEFSGRRGFHLYLFVETPIFSSVMRGSLKTLLKRANEHSDEIFPYSNFISRDYIPKAIKLVPAKHQKGGQSGFIDPLNIEWDGELIKVPNQEVMFSQIKFSSVDILTELAMEQPESKDKTTAGVNWDELQSPHPPCIQSLIQAGVPPAMEYNRANMTLVRYGFSRNLKDDQIKMLGYQMAAKSQNHPTSKNTVQAKMENFKSVIGSMGKNRTDPKNAWSCSYLWAEKELRKFCLGCNLQSSEEQKQPKIQVNQADVLAEQELIGYVLAHPESLDYALDQMVMSDCFLSTRKVGEPIKDIPITGMIYEAMEDSQNDLRPSTILATLPDELVDPCAEYIQEILNLPVCSVDTFHKHCVRIRENGIRLASVMLAQDSIESFLDRKTPLEFALDQLSNQAERLHTKQSTGSIKPLLKRLPDLLEELMDNNNHCIPSHSTWQNHVLNGGYGVKRMYVIAAPPGAGKTTFVCSEADFAASQGFPVILLEYEMDDAQLWFYSLARIAGINSRVIEQRKFLDPNYPNRNDLEQTLGEAIKQHRDTIAPRFFFKDADETVTPTSLKGYIKQVRAELGLADNFPVLVIIDYLQLMQSGIQTLDESTNETLRVSRVASALTRVARSTNAAIICISDITKEAYKKALESGKGDMGALRDSFKVAHAATGVAILQAGSISVQAKKEEPALIKDQIDLMAERYESTPRVKQAILQLKDKYHLNRDFKARYAVLAWVKLRGSVLGTPAFVYEKATHRYIPMEIDIMEDLANDD